MLFAFLAAAAAVAAPPLPQAKPIDIVDIDATAGFDKDATWTVKRVVHGDDAIAVKTALSTASAADAERAVKSYFREAWSDIDPEQAGWRFDERHSTVVLSLKSKAKVDWDGDDKQGRSLTLVGAGFYAPAKFERPKDQ